MRLFALGLLALVAGCAGAAPTGGSIACTVDVDCPTGYRCVGGACYAAGEVPACTPKCGGQTPFCDPQTVRCVQCLADADCPVGDLCVAKVCKPGCSRARPGCAADAGACDVDLGVCRGCLVDRECADPNAPRCDKAQGRCVPCLPEGDNCPAGRYCEAQRCVPGCKDDGECGGGGGGIRCCAHQCTDLAADGKNCGACGNVCVNNGACCAGMCADLMRNALNCGRCGFPCFVANGTAACVAGACAVDTCAPGFGDCDKSPQNGCESRLATDPKNCGACGKACAAGPNQTATCAAGSCAVACAMGFADCDGNAQNGCEANLEADLANCGACKKACPGIPNASSICLGGACALASCNAGFKNCDGQDGNGCEVNVQSDPKNCGACALVCPSGPNATSGCTNGACQFACVNGFADCDKVPGNGCERNVATDPANCGGCGRACPAVGNGVAGCAAGSCTAVCNNGWGDCDGNVANGCEANLNTSTTSCGGCGKVCGPLANATVACAGGVCGIAACAAGYANCDGNVANGCEINIGTDAKNCGACGKACAQGQQCIQGACAAGGCLAGGKTPPAACVNGTDPETGDSYTICSADCTSAWIASTKNGGGIYHAAQICQLYGYSNYGQTGGTCGTMCGYCNGNANSCNNLGPKSFDGGGTSCGTDQFGQKLCYTVHWTCVK